MATQTRGKTAEKAARPGGRSGSGGRDGRPAKAGFAPVVFVRHVVAELRKVIWPTRKELGTYTLVALVFILIMTGIVTGLDYAFTKLVFYVFG